MQQAYLPPQFAYDPAIGVPQMVYVPQPVQIPYISPNPFEYPPGHATYMWFYKDPKGYSQGPFNAF